MSGLVSPHLPCTKSDPTWCTGCGDGSGEVGGENGHPLPQQSGWCFVRRRSPLGVGDGVLSETDRVLAVSCFQGLVRSSGVSFLTIFLCPALVWCLSRLHSRVS